MTKPSTKPASFPDGSISSVAFYLPSQLENGEPIPVDRKKLIQAVMSFLLDKFGGGTRTQGSGYFLDKKRKTHIEDVDICQSYFSPDSIDDLEDLEKQIGRLANSLAIEFHQESLAVDYNHVLYLFSPNGKYRDKYADIKRSWLSNKTQPIGVDKYLALALKLFHPKNIIGPKK